MQGIVIGVNGVRGAGKDTFYTLMLELDQRVVRCAWADPLKERLCEFLGITREELEANKERYRKIMQEYGMIMREKHGRDYWINIVKERIEGHLERAKIVIVTDCRLHNEFDYIEEQKGLLVKVSNVVAEQRAVNEIELHVSERVALSDDVSRFDYVVDNNDCMSTYRTNVRSFYVQAIQTAFQSLRSAQG